jgi:hypothetical protein
MKSYQKARTREEKKEKGWVIFEMLKERPLLFGWQDIAQKRK